MPAKKPEPRIWWRNFYFDQHQRASLVCEDYPGVSSITIELEFYSMNNPASIKRETRTFSQGEKAFFHVDCKDSDCIAGGFNFSTLVGDAVKDPRNPLQGDLHCTGKTEFSKTRTLPCSWHARYTVTVVPNIT